MPYISDHKRRSIEYGMPPGNVGELNYAITMEINRFLHGTVDYQAFNDVIGVLECAKLELYRRLVAPYEDKKIAENGDVY